MSSSSDLHQDLYVRITYVNVREPTITPDNIISFVQEHRTWNPDLTLKTVRERHEHALVEVITRNTYLKELHREPHSN